MNRVRAAAGEYLGWEPLRTLPDKESGQSDVLGWDTRRMRRWLGRLGDPQCGMRCTLVAGSKGKGSTATFLEAALRHAGRRTGLYTQPHLHRYAERVQVAGRPLGATRSRAALREVLARAPGPVTAFEAATAAALWAFARAGVEDAVLELGFGGRLDAVAEVEPELVLFGPIELEHAALFGPDLPAVARQEFSLIRFGRICLSGPQVPEVAELFGRELAAHGAEGGLVPAPEPLPMGAEGELALASGRRLRVRLGLAGGFQWGNAALAARGAEALGAPPMAIAAGLGAAWLPGRFETVAQDPRVLVDGAHTPGSAAALAAALGQLDVRGPVALVLGVLQDKDAAGIGRALAPRVQALWATTPNHPRALAAPLLATCLGGLVPAMHVVPAPLEALARARDWVGPRGLVVAAGSLHLAAQVRWAVLQAGRRVPRLRNQRTAQ